ncbi:MAG TPA: hypothetical protein VGP76_01065 [Planctomycetaceae bacterium]|nr:hypothetical protein [Planctomycetaceae bacterium]
MGRVEPALPGMVALEPLGAVAPGPLGVAGPEPPGAVGLGPSGAAADPAEGSPVLEPVANPAEGQGLQG